MFDTETLGHFVGVRCPQALVSLGRDGVGADDLVHSDSAEATAGVGAVLKVNIRVQL